MKFVALGVLIVGATSCNKDRQEPILTSGLSDNGENLGFSLRVQAEDIEFAADVDPNEMRSVGYTLEGDKKVLKLNFLEVAKAKGTTQGVVPVNLFFINTKKGMTSLVFKQVMMNVEGARQLSLPFTNFPEIKAKYDDQTADAWFVKGFIGGQMYKKGSDNDGLQFPQDGLYDITDATTSIVTSSVKDVTRGSWGRFRRPDPMPMESAWRPIQFFFSQANIPDGSDASKVEGNANYPTDGQMLDFKPFGSIIRLKVTNEMDEPYRCKVLDFSPTPWYWDGNADLKAKVIYINNISRKVTSVPATRVALRGGKEVLEIIDPQDGGMTTLDHYDGTVHYHSGTATGTGDGSYKELTIEPKKARYFMFWVKERAGAPESCFVQPFIHNRSNKAYLEKGPNARDKEFAVRPIYLGNSEHGITVRRGQYESGKTYFVATKLKRPAATPAP